MDDWEVMGMRATESHAICLEGVFVPDASVALERLIRDLQAARFHPLPEWDQHAFRGSG